MLTTEDAGLPAVCLCLTQVALLGSLASDPGTSMKATHPLCLPLLLLCDFLAPKSGILIILPSASNVL